MRLSKCLALSCLTLSLLVPPALAIEPEIPANPIEANDVPGIEFSRRLSSYTWPGAERGFRQGITAFYASRANAPLWVDDTGFTNAAKQLIAEIREAGQWGLNADDYALPDTPASDADSRFAAELKVSVAAARYARDARGGRYEPTRLSLNIDRKPPLMATEQVLARLAAASDPAASLRTLHPQHPQFEKLRTIWLKWRDAKPEDIAAELAPQNEEPEQAKSSKSKKQAAKPVEPNPKKLAQRVLYNMEMWRWMPEQLGDYYINVNIPEFEFRVVKGNKIVHQERIVAGKPANQTPIFSDEMETVVFYPFWGVPDSIKVKELLPGLRRGGDPVSRQGLRIKYGNRDVHPSQVDWSTTDIRNFHVYQPPGRGNALGIVKFLFPNRHQVYLHDTPTKHLFNSAMRAYSHGCMRVRDPVKLAEVLLGNDKGWSHERIAQIIKAGQEDNAITLDRKVPVHITYFTVRVRDDGKPVFFRDIYGHEPLIQMGLDGKSNQIVLRKQNLDDLVGRSDPRSTGSDFFGGGFGGGFFSSAPPANTSSRDRSWVRNAFNND